MGTIYNKTTTSFSFSDRIKILFGKKLIIDTTIKCDVDDINVLDTKSHTHIEPFIKRKGEILLTAPMDRQEARNNKIDNLIK